MFGDSAVLSDHMRMLAGIDRGTADLFAVKFIFCSPCISVDSAALGFGTVRARCHLNAPIRGGPIHRDCALCLSANWRFDGTPNTSANCSWGDFCNLHHA
jgi:hypothetical protein